MHSVALFEVVRAFDGFASGKPGKTIDLSSFGKAFLNRLSLDLFRENPSFNGQFGTVAKHVRCGSDIGSVG